MCAIFKTFRSDLNDVVFESGPEDSRSCCSGFWYNTNGLGMSSKIAKRRFGYGYARIVRNAHGGIKKYHVTSTKIRAG